MRWFSHHPDTGGCIEGFLLPFWCEVKALALRAQASPPLQERRLGYRGNPERRDDSGGERKLRRFDPTGGTSAGHEKGDARGDRVFRCCFDRPFSGLAEARERVMRATSHWSSDRVRELPQRASLSRQTQSDS